MYDTRSIKALRRVSLTINLWRIAWLKASKKAIESPKSRRKKRSKQSLQRRAKRRLQRVGSRPLDQARRNRSESLPQCDGKPRTTTTARTSVTSGGVGGVIVSFIADSLPTSAARLRAGSTVRATVSNGLLLVRRHAKECGWPQGEADC
jgi:hypothetical protein